MALTLQPKQSSRRSSVALPAIRPLLLALLILPALSADAGAIPAFARKYRVSCQLCHNPVPTLNEFGEQFAGNGFRFGAAEPPRDTIATGDPLLELARDLPLALRLDGYVQGFANGDVATDLKTPYNVKILSGGTLGKGISYYLYFFLFERGEVGGIEDAFIYFNDIWGAPVDVMAGQFQVSDPMFKRELRLEYEDYAIYRARIGDQPTDLTYDRGIMGAWDVAGLTLSGAVINGAGKGEAEPDLNLDNDIPKNVFGHASWPLVRELRLGAMGYWGRQDAEVDGVGAASNEVWMAGVDATLSLGSLEVNGQYVHREDDSPTFSAGEPTVKTDGGFAEAIYRFRGGRWYALALYNNIFCDAPLLDVRLGGPADIQRYQTLTGGAGWLFRRNFRFLVEGTWDVEQEYGRFTLGVVTAF
jgi:hypothetical protein